MFYRVCPPAGWSRSSRSARQLWITQSGRGLSGGSAGDTSSFKKVGLVRGARWLRRCRPRNRVRFRTCLREVSVPGMSANLRWKPSSPAASSGSRSAYWSRFFTLMRGLGNDADVAQRVCAGVRQQRRSLQRVTRLSYVRPILRTRHGCRAIGGEYIFMACSRLLFRGR